MDEKEKQKLKEDIEFLAKIVATAVAAGSFVVNIHEKRNRRRITH
jgi:hypothetical protein